MNMRLIAKDFHSKVKKDETEEYWTLDFVYGDNHVRIRIEDADYDESEWHDGAQYSITLPQPTDVLKKSIKKKGKQAHLDEFAEIEDK